MRNLRISTIYRTFQYSLHFITEEISAFCGNRRKILADGFICHYDNYDGPSVETWGMALAIEAKLRNPYEKINLKYIMEVLKACIGEGLALK